MRKFFPDLFLLLMAGLVAVWWVTRPTTLNTTEAVGIDYAGDLSKGGVVFNAGGCASCHMTPGQTDRKKLGGGLALKTDFGTFIVPNISSHKTDGIGAWSALDLANAMLRGVSPKGEHYYPAFPYTTYAHATIDDIRDLMAYLRTLPAIEGKAPDHDLAFPFSVRGGLGLWKALYLDTRPIVPDSTKSAAWNRGHYLVEALAHCAECHSPRDMFGGIVKDKRYAGGPDPEGSGFLPNISGKNLGSWSKDEVLDLLETGMTPDDKVAGSMADVVKNTSALPKSDREAMAEYLKSLPALESPPKPAKK
jgi:mono/diheme cytochrome c family protein